MSKLFKFHVLVVIHNNHPIIKKDILSTKKKLLNDLKDWTAVFSVSLTYA